jgi:hypothetical protein
VLGEHFERLTGANVSVVGEDRVLQVTSKAYAWPKDTCTPVTPQTRMADCPPQRSIFTLTTSRVEWYAGQFLAMADQWKPCMVWASTSTTYRWAHPWPRFRDQFTVWLEATSRLPTENTSPRPTITTSSERVAFRGTTLPMRIDIVYLVGNVGVASATLVHTDTAYELTGLVLITVTA